MHALEELPLPTPLRTFSDMEALIDRAGFAPAAAQIGARALRCWHVCPAGKPDVGLIGDSRLGGSPVLEAGRPWPKSRHGRSLSFIGQFRLSDLSRVDAVTPLPATGLLSLFAGEFGIGPIEALALVTPVGTTVTHLTRQAEDDFNEETPGYPLGHLRPTCVRLEPGVSFTEDLWRLDRIKDASPGGGDIDALMEGGQAVPEGAAGQLLGHIHAEDECLLRRADFEDIGRPHQVGLVKFGSWEAWEEAKKIRHTFRRGLFRKPQIHHPWTAKDDDNVRWVLAHQAEIAAGIQRWRLLLALESSRSMDLGIGALFFFAPLDDTGRMDLSRVRMAGRWD
jgi:hypothetical protein